MIVMLIRRHPGIAVVGCSGGRGAFDEVVHDEYGRFGVHSDARCIWLCEIGGRKSWWKVRVG